MTLDGRVLYFTYSATTTQLLEALLIKIMKKKVKERDKLCKAAVLNLLTSADPH
jgi:hypothetical protein